jgi:probable F420-dependent oxidoreductase
VAFAERAEQLGLDSLWVLERLLRVLEPSAGPVIPEAYGTVYSPLETLAFLAARTSTIRLGTSVLDALFHAPVALGRQLATLDQLSGGRLLVGLGQGWSPEEFDTVGVSMSRRGNGFEDFLAALTAIWGPDPVSYEGRFYRFAASQVSPKPVRPGGPPVLLGAMPGLAAPAQRAGRLGFGFNPGIYDWSAFENQLAAFQEAVPAGAHPGPVVVRINGTVTAEALGADRLPLTGDAAQVREDLARAASLGVDEVFWDLVQGGVPHSEHLATLDRVVRLREAG